MVAEGYQPCADVQKFVDDAEQSVYALARDVATTNAVGVRAVADAAFSQLLAAFRAAESGEIPGLTTGFLDLDDRLSGLHPGELVVLAARPGMGKTAMALDVTRAVTARGTGALVFSLEMPKEQLAMRMFCQDAQVDVGSVRKGRVSADGWQRLSAAAGVVSKQPLHFDDSPSLALHQLRATARRVAADAARAGHKLGLVVVDYIQLMQGDPDAQNREQQVAGISRGLKQLARELNVCVLALSQLNRGVESRARDKRPMLSDLRESGAIEQDADAVLLLYRDDYYRDVKPEKRGIAEVIVAKQRNGPTGTVYVRWVAESAHFCNLARGEYPEDDAA